MNPLALLLRLAVGYPLTAVGFLAALFATPLRRGWDAGERTIRNAMAARGDAALLARHRRT